MALGMNQATRIAGKFGGFRRLANAIRKTPATVYRWGYSKERGGTGGLVPSSAVPDVLSAADLLGIDLTKEDWLP